MVLRTRTPDWQPICFGIADRRALHVRLLQALDTKLIGFYCSSVTVWKIRSIQAAFGGALTATVSVVVIFFNLVILNIRYDLYIFICLYVAKLWPVRVLVSLVTLWSADFRFNISVVLGIYRRELLFTAARKLVTKEWVTETRVHSHVCIYGPVFNTPLGCATSAWAGFTYLFVLCILSAVSEFFWAEFGVDLHAHYLLLPVRTAIGSACVTVHLLVVMDPRDA